MTATGFFEFEIVAREMRDAVGGGLVCMSFERIHGGVRGEFQHTGGDLCDDGSVRTPKVFFGLVEPHISRCRDTLATFCLHAALGLRNSYQ